MARKTDGEKIDELEKLGATLIERLDTTIKELEVIKNAHSETARALHALRLEYEKEILLQKREIEDLKKWKDDQKKERDERSRKLWSFGPNILSAVISGLIAAAVVYFISRR